jgi:hypothetical protein
MFAVPEHTVLWPRLGADQAPRLALRDAIVRLHANRRLVPVALDPARAELLFADLGEHRYREWQHIYSVARCADEGRIGECFRAPAELLDAPEPLPDAERRDPRGLILHVSRCGSTLLGKALARADGIGVINQPAILQHGFWAWVSGEWRQRDRWDPASDPRHAVRFRNLMHLLCRPRLDDEQQIFIKFISWNSLYVDFIRAAFPQTPALYMYRDPIEVIASVFRETTAVLMARERRQAEFLSGLERVALDRLDEVGYLAACYAHGFEAILAARRRPAMLNYRALAPGRLPDILDAAFGLRPDPQRLEQMQSQFAVYSKDDQGRTRFRDDRERKRAALDDNQVATVREHCAIPYDRLRAAADNFA